MEQHKCPHGSTDKNGTGPSENSGGIWSFSGEAQKSFHEGNCACRSSITWREAPSLEVRKARNFSCILISGLNSSSHRNCPSSLISRNHQRPSASIAKSRLPKEMPAFLANSSTAASTSGGVSILLTSTSPWPASCRQSSAPLGLCRE